MHTRVNTQNNSIDKAVVEKSIEHDNQSSMLQQLFSLSKEMLSRIKRIEDRFIQNEVAQWNARTAVGNEKRKLTQDEIFLKNIGLPFSDMDALNGFDKKLDEKDFETSVVSDMNIFIEQNIFSEKNFTMIYGHILYRYIQINILFIMQAINIFSICKL